MLGDLLDFGVTWADFCSSGGAGGTYIRTISCGEIARGVGVIIVVRPKTLSEQRADLKLKNKKKIHVKKA